MRLNKYHKEVLREALTILEECGDDSFLDIDHNPKTQKALRELWKASKLKEPKVILPKYARNIPRDADSIRQVIRSPKTGRWIGYNAIGHQHSPSCSCMNIKAKRENNE